MLKRPDVLLELALFALRRVPRFLGLRLGLLNVQIVVIARLHQFTDVFAVYPERK